MVKIKSKRSIIEQRTAFEKLCHKSILIIHDWTLVGLIGGIRGWRAVSVNKKLITAICN